MTALDSDTVFWRRLQTAYGKKYFTLDELVNDHPYGAIPCSP